MIAKAVFQLHNLSSPQHLDVAAEQLQSGLGFVFQDTWFLHEAGRLWCNAIHVGSDAEAAFAARGRMDESRRALQQVCAAHSAIKRLADSVPILFAVVEDYGQGVAPLCCLVDDHVVTGAEAWQVWRRA